MPNDMKKDFCCLIISGFGAGSQAGSILRDHMRDNGIDTFLTTPSGKDNLRLQKEHWVHGVRMEYLNLCRKYRRIAVIGMSLGGVLLYHLADLKPAAMIFLNTPAVTLRQSRTWDKIYRTDLRSRVRTVHTWMAKRQLTRLVEETAAKGKAEIECPVLVLQTTDDPICNPVNADEIFRQLRVQNKNIRFYPEGGHDVLASRTVYAVCSDVFQFCSRVRGSESEIE